MAESATSTARSVDVAVFGAGLIGLCTAFELTRAGHKVTLFDHETLGSGAARGNAGEVTPLQVLPMPEPKQLKEIFRGVASNRHYLSIDPTALPWLSAFGLGFMSNCTPAAVRRNTRDLDQLVNGMIAAFDSMATDGIDLGGGGTGFLNTHNSVDALRDARDAQAARARHLGTPEPGPIMLDDELHDYEPFLKTSVRAGFVAETERFLDPDIFVDSLINWLRKSSVTIHEHATLTSISDGTATVSFGGDSTGSSSQREETVEFDRAVVAIGAWSSLTEIPGLDVMKSAHVTSGVGYSFRVDPEILPKNLVSSLDYKTIGVPMSGHLRVVGLMDFSRNTVELKNSRMKHLHREAAAFMQGVGNLPRTEEWSGPRPMTPTGLPIISALPDAPRVIVATGHNMHGLSLGPVTGEVVSQIIAGQAPEVAGKTLNMRPFAL
ncbi:NAD(P)/FAD-dependent oxidoreductase [Auritidibacter ignavus]|uniref:NAD(P)/FAD-dependent oxidoreductase n=1 Tax=Auritidibacter ignavus TaxID=678932 RepID=UPI00109C56D0|nr:FAD-binding oxidoreductase [Auritidibacter ignavus]